MYSEVSLMKKIIVALVLFSTFLYAGSIYETDRLSVEVGPSNYLKICSKEALQVTTQPVFTLKLRDGAVCLGSHGYDPTLCSSNLCVFDTQVSDYLCTSQRSRPNGASCATALSSTFGFDPNNVCVSGVCGWDQPISYYSTPISTSSGNIIGVLNGPGWAYCLAQYSKANGVTCFQDQECISRHCGPDYAAGVSGVSFPVFVCTASSTMVPA